MKFHKLVKEYYKSPAYRTLSDNSKRTYDHCINHLEDHFRGRDIVEIKRSELARLMNSKSDTPASANLMLRVASVLFSFAMEMDELPFNPAARLKKLKIGSHTRWHIEDVRKAIAHRDRVLSMAVALAWYTGQREGDILNMRWCDVRDGYIHVKQAKTGVELKIKVHEELGEILMRYCDEPDTDYLVSGPVKLAPQAFRGRFRRAMDRLGIYKTFHGIRKGVASELAEKGHSTKEIAALLGHKTTRMAEFYAQQASERKLAESAVNSLSL